MFDRAPVGVGPRAAAFVLDLAFVVLIIVTVWGLAGGVNQTAENNTSLTDPNTAASLVIAAERLVGLRVAMLDGSPLTGRAVFMRTVGRFFDCSLFSPIVAAVFVWSSPHNQRLGVRWGGTIVIRTGRRRLF